MTDDATLETLRAAAETIVPATDGMAGAAELGVERHVASLLDKAMPNLSMLVAGLLNAYASERRPGAAFAELDDAERSDVLRAMSVDESQDIRDAVDAVIVFTLGGAYSEWSGFDRTTRVLRPPAVWGEIGYLGPVHGHPVYLEPDLEGHPRPESVMRGPEDV